MTRNWLAVLVVATLIIALPASSVALAQESPSDAFDGTLSPQLADGEFDDAVRYDGLPSVYVTYDDGKNNSLATWAEGNTDRDIIAWDNESNRALVAASLSDLGLTRLQRTLGYGDGLASESYVEHMALNTQVGYAEPISVLDTADEYERPTYARVAAAMSTDATYDDFSGDGLAYSEDTEKSSMADVKAAVGADGLSVNGSGVRVAVIDSGLNAENMTGDPLYGDRLAAPKNTITNETGLDAVRDGNGHGSWVAGAIAADPDNTTEGEAYEGVAPGATVIPIKALSDEGSGSTQDIVEGIEHAQAENADIISMSLGSPMYNPTIAAEIDEFLANGGTAVIVAAGNSKSSPTAPLTRYISSPADAPGVIAVQATSTNNSTTAKVSYFGEVGPDNGLDASNGVTVDEAPDVAAPGMNVTAATLTDNGIRRNATLSGTSMSTPVVAGVGALMLEAQPSLENESESFRGYMMNTSARMPNAGVTETRAGLVNAENATSLTTTDEDQEDVRNDRAVARDLANRAYSGSSIVRVLTQWMPGMTVVASP
ncbi:hypothetical protein C2R22_24495 (plasmid) [Salinigranum rubrum]|uniref:Peptidase S8/S53 domain-containing protein n=1 Tax=Salinigranum rubrum TaxID=755307 RepID=A0A2I8VRZ0_9EURY|nr:S8 family serine peptidase [Salinigranum rubrum]AUV84691.1 hypothetical protein C2R22_24495 [Salinigranum rubrum]